MAKYELRTTTWYEDNEEAADAQQQQAFVEDWAKSCIEHWHRSKVHMIVSEGDKSQRYTCDADGGPTASTDLQIKRPIHRWPWMKASELPPTVGDRVAVYTEEDDTIRYGKFVSNDHIKSKGIKAPFFHVWDYEGAEEIICEPEFEKVWWRTVEKPIIK